MGEVRGFGITHFPLLAGLDKDMNSILVRNMQDPAVPDAEKDPKNWPEAMQEEWADPLATAQRHRADLVRNMDKVREALDEFNPDVVIMWGDDQYELFREEIIPSFSVLAFNETTVHPFAHGRPNIWGEGPETEVTIKMDRSIGTHFARELLGRGIDTAYSYVPREGAPFPHAFLNALLYLDYHRDKGFPYNLLPISVNCYGSHVIANRGGGSTFGEQKPLDPPSPTPHRCMELGSAIAQIAEESPYKVALMASSGWSHGFLTDKYWRLRPDVEADRRLYTALVEQDYKFWHNYRLDEIEDAGQQECLNWFCLLGAMEQLGRKPLYTDFLQSLTGNSSKIFAIYE
jgi:hypothetical protein